MDTGSDLQSIKCWREDDRPREKLELKGRHALSDAELLAILLGSGSRNESALDLAKRMLDHFKGFSQLAKAGISELTGFKGVGKAKAITILSGMEIARRTTAETAFKRIAIQSSQAAYEAIYPYLADLDHEQFWILLLNRANHLINPLHISTGGMSGTVADSKVIFKKALEHKASAIILAHNHPSGNRKASRADIQLTEQLSKAGKLLDISVLDHIIVADKNYFSFADEGMMTG